jgi:hypothetical protein
MASPDPAAAALRKRSGGHPPSLHPFDFQHREPLGVRGFSTNAKVHYLFASWWFLDCGATESSPGTSPRIIR